MLDLIYNNNSEEILVGVDEVGRGCLWGPLVIGCVIWDANNPINNNKEAMALIKDSKKMSKSDKVREQLRNFIEENAITFHIEFVNIDEIDELNILHATLNGMHRALNNIYTKHDDGSGKFDRIMADGDKFNIYTAPDGYVKPHICIPGGDNKYVCIAAASMLAKIYRDEWVKNYVNLHPELKVYGIHTNVGYGAKKHYEGLQEHGYTDLHRRSFNPVKDMIIREQLHLGASANLVSTWGTKKKNKTSGEKNNSRYFAFIDSSDEE